MSEESKVTPISPIKLPELPDEVQKQVVALKHVSLCHNVIGAGTHPVSSFEAVRQCMNFLGKLHLDISEEISQCSEAESYPDLAPIFARKKHAAELMAEAKRLEDEEKAKTLTEPTPITKGAEDGAQTQT